MASISHVRSHVNLVNVESNVGAKGHIGTLVTMLSVTNVLEGWQAYVKRATLTKLTWALT